MNIRSRNLEELLERLVTPLQAFYQRESEMAEAPCFVQPYPQGQLVEYSWRQVGDQVRRMATYLRSLDLEPGSNIAIMSTNCAYWIMADLAIWMAGHCSVPLYPVLASKTINQILVHSGAKVLFAGKLQDWETMRSGVPESTRIIGFPLSPESITSEYVNWTDITQASEPCMESPVFPADNTATIIYTSGTTGMPKGVMHSFGNMSVVGTLAGEIYNIGPEDRKISYLPLAHVAERVAIEVNQFYYGYTVYFSHSLKTFADDLRRARPTLFFAVPRIWTRFQQRVLENIDDLTLQHLLRDPQQAPMVRTKLLTALGLQDLRVAVSGAAPLPTALIDWYKGLGLEILEGYAMSENFAYSHTTRSGHAKTGYVGTPSPYVDCKLSDTGEVLVKSPSNMQGYYREPELTGEVLDGDGFLYTGDLGEIDDQGRLRIVGRSKELFKTSKGKYVAPAPLENKLQVNLNLELICVVGANLTQPIALVNLSESAVKMIEAGQQNLVEDSLLGTLKAVNAEIDKHENISHIVVMREPWTIENRLVTPTLKVRRSELEKLFAGQFVDWQRAESAIVFNA